MAKAKSSQPAASKHAMDRALLQQLVFPVLLLLGVFIFGTVGFFILGGGKWSLFDCAYTTSITLTTVGFGEILEDFGRNGRLFAMVLMWSGMGVALYAVSTITGFVVERKFSRILRERKMEKSIAALRDHFIVCGGGHTAVNVLRELITSKRSCVCIELKPERIEWIASQFEGLYYIQGDATEEDVLLRAGIERASGVLAVLYEDSHNLLITVQARYINPEIKIVVRCHENNLADKFYRAGANYIVNPSFIGGMRMASEMIRPHAVSFLDRMLRGNDAIRVEEVTIGERSRWIGHSLREIDIQRRTGLIAVSLKRPEDPEFTYNPSQDEVLTPQSVIVVIGNPEQISNLRRFCAEEGDDRSVL
ncbi:MAG TPA: potassium channel protein [Deltaproteobacteria bacterium]|jgi:voltage-gated potassium channel|nr:potassium channel protein [Deltaproteobacteria bacterium]HIJ75135.1 potassium channel protein [Deltaproteobacteria bacterium]